MVDATPGLSPVQGKALVARFVRGRQSSDGGLLALRQIERRLGLAARLAGSLKDPWVPERVVHRLAGDQPVSDADDRGRLRGRQRRWHERQLEHRIAAQRSLALGRRVVLAIDPLAAGKSARVFIPALGKIGAIM
jgi:hypothetical protein